MSNELVRKSLENSLEIGGLSDLAKAAEVVMLLIDTSGSMFGSPVESLRKVVANIQQAGHVPMIAFGGPYDAQVRFVDHVPEPDGGTPLHIAIPFAKEYGANRLVVISDGMPDLSEESMNQAKLFGGQIDVIYIGQEGGPGSVFLDALAKATGGKRREGNIHDTKAITSMVIGLLEGDVEPARAPIQGAGFTAVEMEPVEPEDEEDDDDSDDDEDEDDDDDDDDTDDDADDE